MGRLDFRRLAAYSAPPVAHALHDNDVDVVDGHVAKVVHDGLQAEPEPALSLGCRCRVPLTQVHNPSSVLLLYRDQLDTQTLD